MFKKKKVKDFEKDLAKKYGLSIKQVHQILMLGMNNIMEMIKKGEDIRIPKFGNIYFNKKAFVNYLITKIRKK